MKLHDIGQVPSASVIELADTTRRIASSLLRVDGDPPELAAVRRRLLEVSQQLDALASPHDAPRVLRGDPAATRPYYFPGALEPRVHVAIPWMSATQDGDRRHGQVRFELMHEGPPGCVHGGHVAFLFDQAFGQHAVANAFGGPTHRLELTYRRVTPLQRTLHYEVHTERLEGRKLFAGATLRDDDALLAEATALFVRPRGAPENLFA